MVKVGISQRSGLAVEQGLQRAQIIGSLAKT